MIFIVSIAFIFFQQKPNVNLVKKYVKIKIFVTFFVMPSEDTKILEFNYYQRSDKVPIIIYVKSYENEKNLLYL